MNDSLSSGTDRHPSDEQMDNMLREFFVLETPSRLRQPWREVDAQDVMPSAVSVVTVPVDVTAARPGSRRIAVASAISVLAMTLLVALTVRENGANPNASSVLLSPDVSPVGSPAEERMNVSSGDESAGSGTAVGEDGITQEELDTIQLAPRN